MYLNRLNKLLPDSELQGINPTDVYAANSQWYRDPIQYTQDILSPGRPENSYHAYPGTTEAIYEVPLEIIPEKESLIPPEAFDGVLSTAFRNYVSPPIIMSSETSTQYAERNPQLTKKYVEDTPIDTEATWQLRELFASDLEGVSLPGIAIAFPKCRLPKRLRTDFRLVPVIRNPTSTKAIKRVGVPEDVKTNYGYEGGSPFLDTSFAIGLVYRGTLSAVAGAAIAKNGLLVVKQNQCVNTADRSREGMNKTGLRNGMAWRHTLVRAWEHIAESHNKDVMIQGAANNSWRNTVPQSQLYTAYDNVASDLGYTFNPADKNWYQKPSLD